MASAIDRVVIDTNIAVYIAKANERGRRYAKLIEGKTVAVSFITVAELDLIGRKAADPVAVREYWQDKLRLFAILWPDHETCAIWANITAVLKPGMTRQDNDLWIAAAAIRYDLPLITHNAKDFVDIAGLNLVTLPDITK